MDYRDVLTIPVSNNILDDVLERLQTVPGVTAVGAVNQTIPVPGPRGTASEYLAGRPNIGTTNRFTRIG